MSRPAGSVLGIDAAWTVTQPSGVALVTDDGDGCKLVAVDSSYAAFYRRAGLDGAATASMPTGYWRARQESAANP
jgi:hypothetical protein